VTPLLIPFNTFQPTSTSANANACHRKGCPEMEAILRTEQPSQPDPLFLGPFSRFPPSTSPDCNWQVRCGVVIIVQPLFSCLAATLCS
jgi:hypothetical protein